MIGKVKWWNDAKGFGFIQADSIDDCQGAIFVHYSAICSNGFKTLAEDNKVTFELSNGPKGPQAFEVYKVTV